MRYSVMNGGKRIRPLLLYASADALQAPASMKQDMDRLACALEYIHSYSLVHDDLPAMDNDDLRRGKPACHRAFDEAAAILAGDALQSEAFALIANSTLDSHVRIELIRYLATASGATGMVGGQAIDLAAIGQDIELSHLEAMHRLKTGALIRASVALAAIASGANQEQQHALDLYAINIGLAFQVQDDILDIESDTTTLGKTQGADLALGKPTYPALLGMAGAKQKLESLYQAAIAALEPFGQEAARLQQLADFIVKRTH
jgi:geranylgeranyl pyrophosphate synthase